MVTNERYLEHNIVTNEHYLEHNIVTNERYLEHNMVTNEHYNCVEHGLPIDICRYFIFRARYDLLTSVRPIGRGGSRGLA